MYCALSSTVLAGLGTCRANIFLFKAAAANAEARSLTMDCFERIPEVIGEANEHLLVYSEHSDLWNEESLRKAAVALSVAILEAVRVMISWFEKPEWSWSD